MSDTHRLAISLLALRLTTAAFMAVWAIRKIATPDAGQRVFETFYFSSPSEAAILAVGTAQLFVIGAFALGAFRFWSYGAIAVMHSVSTLSTYERLADPFTSPNALFWAAVPLVAALWGLFALRKADRLWSVDATRAATR